MSVLALKTIANQAFGVPFAGGPTVAKASYGGTELGSSAPDPSAAPTTPGLS